MGRRPETVVFANYHCAILCFLCFTHFILALGGESRIPRGFAYEYVAKAVASGRVRGGMFRHVRDDGGNCKFSVRSTKVGHISNALNSIICRYGFKRRAAPPFNRASTYCHTCYLLSSVSSLPCIYTDTSTLIAYLNQLPWYLEYVSISSGGTGGKPRLCRYTNKLKIIMR